MDLQLLRENRSQGVVAFSQFALLREKHNSSIFCCFEGEDSKYYLKKIEEITRATIDDIIPFNCGGKSEVLRFYSLIKKNTLYNNIKLGYFVDRDFDESIIEDYRGEVYETPCYSVENLYSTLNAFKRILKCEFQLNEADLDYRTCINLFLLRKEEFHQHIKLFNVWLWCQKDLYNEGKAGRLNWDKFKLTKIVPSITLDKVYTEPYDKDRLESEFFPEAPKVNEEIMQIRLQEIEEKDCNTFFRGKFEIEFLYNFIVTLRSEMGQKGRFTKRNGTHINLCKSNILSELSGYACTPEGLKTYIVTLT